MPSATPAGLSRARAGEEPFLEAHPGVGTPVMHYSLPAYVRELNAC